MVQKTIAENSAKTPVGNSIPSGVRDVRGQAHPTQNLRVQALGRQAAAIGREMHGIGAQQRRLGARTRSCEPMEPLAPARFSIITVRPIAAAR